MKVYLAGAISGQLVKDAKDWRTYVTEKLAEHWIIGVSPLRCEPEIGDRYGLVYADDPKFGTAKAISSKNKFDVRNCDFTLAYLPAAPYSLGTVGELAAASFLGKGTILVSSDNYIINHPVLTGWSDWVVPTLDDAIAVIVGVGKVYVE